MPPFASFAFMTAISNSIGPITPHCLPFKPSLMLSIVEELTIFFKSSLISTKLANSIQHIAVSVLLDISLKRLVVPASVTRILDWQLSVLCCRIRLLGLLIHPLLSSLDLFSVLGNYQEKANAEKREPETKRFKLVQNVKENQKSQLKLRASFVHEYVKSAF